MLCEKCKTAMENSDIACKNCGTKRKRFKKLKLTLMILAMSITLIVVGGVLLDNSGIFPGLDIFGNIRGFFTAPDSPMPQQTADPTNNGQNATQPTPATPTPEPDDDRPSFDEMLAAALLAVEGFVRDNGQFAPLISNMGYLFDYQTQEFVTIQTLVQTGHLSEEFSEFEAGILFLRPIDFEPFDEISLSNSSNLTIFLAYDRPTGIGLISSSEDRAEIFRENLNAIFVDYNHRLGDVRQIRADDSEFELIVAAIQEFKILDGDADVDIDVRFMSANDKFVFAAVSERENSHIINNYILARQESGYTVEAKDFENARNLLAEINNNVPNFDFDLLPDYDIARISLIESDNFEFVIQQIINDELVGNDSDNDQNSNANVVFVSGNNNFVYIVFEVEQNYDINIQRFLGHSTQQSNWNIFHINNHSEARDMMLNLSPTSPPPFYILLWE
ncbi:MAG: hypothetical protein FWD01_01985 [Defluviitaleaceae bacterium]|nr:hypothetical protein [Defluviitaleaceae bacterium]